MLVQAAVGFEGARRGCASWRRGRRTVVQIAAHKGMCVLAYAHCAIVPKAEV